MSSFSYIQLEDRRKQDKARRPACSRAFRGDDLVLHMIFHFDGIRGCPAVKPPSLNCSTWNSPFIHAPAPIFGIAAGIGRNISSKY